MVVVVLVPVNGAFESFCSSCLWEVSGCGFCCSVHVHATYPAQFSVIYFRMKLFICRASPQAVTSEVLSRCPYVMWGPFSASVYWNLIVSSGLSNLAICRRTRAFYAVLDLSLWAG
jgi:hypothetical protein